MSVGKRLRWLLRRGGHLVWLLVFSLLLTFSSVRLQDPLEQVRRFTRGSEFDFLTWTIDAVRVKAAQSSLGTTGYLRESESHDLVLEYLRLVQAAEQAQARLAEVYSDPTLTDPSAVAAPIAGSLAETRDALSQLQPVVEAILQEQVAAVLADLGLGVGGAVLPPVSFHFSSLPDALIISPRTVIRQDANIQLEPGMPLEAHIALERRVEHELGVSALVVPVGGIGTYPTMVQETTSLDWVLETVVHEWIHNYLSLRPLGLNYETTPELRTMNETAASILGTEIGGLVLRRFYPELAPPPKPQQPEAAPVGPAESAEPPPFDFRAEMHTTRVQVDALLEEGKVEEAEAYMEARRQVFYNQGYRFLRRLNQAYFAFYGAYADEPGGAAGEDPVGGAVRELRARSGSAREFLLRMAWMDTYGDLTRALAED
jgi:hypothetical protein